MHGPNFGVFCPENGEIILGYLGKFNAICKLRYDDQKKCKKAQKEGSMSKIERKRKMVEAVNRKILTSISSLFLLVSCPFSSASASVDDVGFASEPYAQRIVAYIKANWIASSLLDKPVEIGFLISDDGTMYNVKLYKSCGNQQLDGECFAAVCTSSPLEHLPAVMQNGNTTEIWVTFVPGEKPARLVDFSHFRQSHDVVGASFIWFKIPPVVLSKFKGVLSDSEVLGTDENLRVTATGETLYTAHLWSKFFSKFTEPTKEQIIAGPLKWLVFP